MNGKEIINLKKYKELIENRKFDEYDIIGFLILIRPYLNNTTQFVLDFANGIAHRERDRGHAFECIMDAAKNGYHVDSNGKVIGYSGINEVEWNKEWNDISKHFSIKITPIIISEITLCIYSLFQFSKFRYSNDIIKKKPELKDYQGTFELLIDNSNNLHFCTSEQKTKRMVCYGRIKNTQVDSKYKNKFFKSAVETSRINKKLYLMYNGEKVLYIGRK